VTAVASSKYLPTVDGLAGVSYNEYRVQCSPGSNHSGLCVLMCFVQSVVSTEAYHTSDL
jgi:hypothetical protein